MLYQSHYQINGSDAHSSVDVKTYSSKKSVLMGLDVYCEKYRLIGKIDLYDSEKNILRERKKKIKQIYDGYIFQVYAQCFALREMGYEVNKIELYSMDDNKSYSVKLPEEDNEMFVKFERIIKDMRAFDMNNFCQENIEKCKKCIYEPACDRTLLAEI